MFSTENYNVETIVKKRSRILFIDEKTLYSQIGNDLCQSVNCGDSWDVLPVKIDKKILTYSRIQSRLFRKGVCLFDVLGDGTRLIVSRHSMYLYDKSDWNLLSMTTFNNDARPMFIAQSNDNKIYYGEYFRNINRNCVNVYVSEDYAKTWNVIYKFEKGTIRHIHGIFSDPYTGSIWMTTGDEDHESAIYVVDKDFRKMEIVSGGNQSARAMQLIFTENFVYFGTDTPFQKNYICRISKKSGNIERLCLVDSSVYWGCKVGESIFFSTAVEPSKIDRERTACVWKLDDGEKWEKICSLKKDWLPCIYFQPAQIFFPQGKNKTGFLFFTPISTEHDQTICRVKIS